ncbi:MULTISPECIES: universal stress protein [Haloferax]|uniref:Universal stress protein n=1 Tax=Haloferax marinum TaxID=2666143 RepID=A0A6A8G505_9EURY|nr:MULTISPECIES: universal stress protein [Haloferax]KAB1196852.1 universal stress protein [Haloferax sp. CBA1150]MRW95865.1 universal stress protein [Haloferax marinum]
MFDHILAPTDGSDHAVRAAEYAVDLAATYGAALHVLYVVDVRTSHADVSVDDDSETRGETAVGTIADLAAARDVPVETEIRVGLPHEVIVDYEAERDIDLVVMGTHGTSGLERYLIGSVAERVVRLSDVPVMCVPPAPADGDA